MDIIRRVGINRLALPVAEQARRFIAPGSIADEGAPSPRKISGTPSGAYNHSAWRNDTLIGSVNLP